MVGVSTSSELKHLHNQHIFMGAEHSADIDFESEYVWIPRFSYLGACGGNRMSTPRTLKDLRHQRVLYYVTLHPAFRKANPTPPLD